MNTIESRYEITIDENTGAVNVADKYEDCEGEIQNVYLVREDIEELIAFYRKNKNKIASRKDF